MKEQYFKALDIFDSENSRFWTRFNLFTGLQLVLVAGIAANFVSLIQSPTIGYLILSAALTFSIFTIIVTVRSRQISLGIFAVILEIEQTDQSFVLMNKYIRHTKSPMGVIARYCVVMSMLLTVFWIAFLVIFSTQ